MLYRGFESPALGHTQNVTAGFEESLNLGVRPAKVEYQAVFLALKN